MKLFPGKDELDRSQRLLYQLRVRLIDQHVAIPRLARIHIHHRLIRLLHRDRLDPRPDALFRRQVEHLRNLPRCPDGAAANLAALGDEREGVEGGQAVLGRADLDKGPVGAEEGQVGFEGHVGGGDGADYEIEGAGVVGGPVFVVVCCDIPVRSDFHRVVLFRGGAADGRNAVCSEGLGRF